MPSADTSQVMPEPLVTRCTSASSARLPPSPRLSARMMMATYFKDTSSMIAQNTSDSTPRILAGVTGRG